MSNQQQKTKMMKYITKYYRHGIIIGYVLLVLGFFIAEIGAQLGIPFLSRVRATNQVLILLGLLFFPFLLSVIISLIQRLRVKVAGVEVDAEFGRIKSKVEAIETGQSQLSGRMDNTQQVFLSILRGKDPFCEERLETSKLVIGCKDFNEQKILSQILAQHIIKGASGIDYQCLIPNGGTIKNYFDLVNGWIDGYIEYTGTGCWLLGIDPQEDPNAVREDSQKYLDAVRKNLNKRSNALVHKVKWLKPLGFTNNYVIVVDKNNLETVKSISDLEHKAEKLTFGGDMEFMHRSDGYPGLRNTYRLNFKKEVICSYGDRYRLLKEKKVDVIVGFQTDPELKDNDLKELNDTKQFFPEYYALPVFREDVLDKRKGLEEIVNQLKDYELNLNAMRELIAQFSVYSGTDMEASAAEKLAKKFIGEF